jgi:hypothetical protein
VTDNVTGIKHVKDSLQINVPNGMRVYVWWKDEKTVRITVTPCDFMFDIGPRGIIRRGEDPIIDDEGRPVPSFFSEPGAHL